MFERFQRNQPITYAPLTSQRRSPEKLKLRQRNHREALHHKFTRIPSVNRPDLNSDGTEPLNQRAAQKVSIGYEVLEINPRSLIL